MLESSGCGGGDSRSELLDTKSKFSDEFVAIENKAASNRGRGNRRSVMFKVEVLWRSFQEGNLMDSSSSDFEARVDSGGEVSHVILLVEKSELLNLQSKSASVSGCGEDGGTFCSEGQEP